jgi:hypothetical protein
MMVVMMRRRMTMLIANFGCKLLMVWMAPLRDVVTLCLAGE